MVRALPAHHLSVRHNLSARLAVAGNRSTDTLGCLPGNLVEQVRISRRRRRLRMA
jgi:hypothetical protein